MSSTRAVGVWTPYLRTDVPVRAAGALTVIRQITGDLMVTRRSALGLGITVPSLAALAACGPNAGNGGAGGGGSDAGGASALRVAWWGNPTRNEDTEEVIDAYTEANTDITITTEPGEWDGYWDKLATQTAASDLPDIIQMDEQYLAEYATRGALLDLGEAGLDTSGFDESAVAPGEVPDVGLAAISAGLNAPAVIANTAVFEEAGVDLPDDTTWTWDDFLEIAEEITEKGDDVFGVGQMATNPALFPVWMRQNGQALWSGDGIGFDESAATSFFEFAKKLGDSDATPGADESIEDGNAGVDQSFLATGRMAMGIMWSSQSVDYDTLIDEKAAILRLPTQTGSASDGQLWYKASMYWAISARTEAQEAAVAFLDHLVNSEAAAEVIGFERGVVGNLELRDVVAQDESEVAAKPADYLDAIAEELGDAPDPTPVGGTAFEDSLTRAGESLMFGDITPEEAAKAVFDELDSAVG